MEKLKAALEKLDQEIDRLDAALTARLAEETGARQQLAGEIGQKIARLETDKKSAEARAAQSELHLGLQRQRSQKVVGRVDMAIRRLEKLLEEAPVPGAARGGGHDAAR